MHNKPHSPEARLKISAARKAKPLKWGHLPVEEITSRLLTTSATVRSIAKEYGCSDSTIKTLFRGTTTKEDRIAVKAKKQSQSLTGYQHSDDFKKKYSERVSGEMNPFYGKMHNAEFKKRQSERKVGVPLSQDHKKALSAALQGVPVAQWIGYKTDESKIARKSSRYAEWRKTVFERDDYTCQMCGNRGGVLHPHHIKKFSSHPELRYEPSNGVTLCAAPCHRNTQGKEELFEKKFTR